MVKQIQTIRRLLPTNCLSVFDHFAGLALKGLTFYVLEYIQVITNVLSLLTKCFYLPLG